MERSDGSRESAARGPQGRVRRVPDDLRDARRHTLLETARDALFLARLPASRLAFVYIAIAASAVAVSQSPWGRRRAGGAFALSRLLGGGALVTFLFWLLLRGQHPIELYALYVWTGLLGSLAVLQFWMVLGELYTLGEAKRLYSLVWTGSLLGATVGAAAARVLSAQAPPNALVLAAAIVLALTAIGPAFALGRAEVASVKRPPAGATLGEGLRLLRGDAYLRALAVLVLVSTVALTLADYVFKSTVARTIPADQLGSFFAGFYTLLNLLSLGAQLVRAVGCSRRSACTARSGCCRRCSSSAPRGWRSAAGSRPPSS
jgi:hypothetical protein